MINDEFEYTIQPKSVSSQNFDISTKLKNAQIVFDKKFEKTFGSVPKEAAELAKFCVSNLIGGVG